MKKFERLRNDKDNFQFHIKTTDGTGTHGDRIPSYSDGTMYLTSGGRIVLNKGWGEYFTPGDTPIFSLQRLCRGVDAKDFLKEVTKLMQKRGLVKKMSKA